jgi:WD40 repeat protein
MFSSHSFPFKKFSGHEGRVTRCWSLSEDRFASTSHDATVRIWSITNHECLETRKGGVVDSWDGCSLGNGLLASATLEGKIYIWHEDTDECVRTLTEKWGISALAFCVGTEGTSLLASASVDNNVRLWDTDTGECRRTLVGHTEWVRGVCSLGSGLLASASMDKTVRIWNVETGDCVRVLVGHTGIVEGVCLLEGGLFASYSHDATVRIWKIDSGECVRILLGHTVDVSTACSLGNGLLATGSAHGSDMRIWKVDTGDCVKIFPTDTTGHVLMAIDKIGPNTVTVAVGCDIYLVKLSDLLTA